MQEIPDEELAVPQTSGIAPQPSAAELAAQAEQYAAEHSSTSLTSKSLVVIFAGVLLISLLAIFLFLEKNSSEVTEPPMELAEVVIPEVASQSAQRAEQAFLDIIFSGTFVEELKSTQQAFDLDWQDRGLAFRLSNLYDLGSIEANSSVAVPDVFIGKRVIVLEITVADTRLTGSTLDVNADKYVALRIGQKDFERADWREQTIQPGQKITVFVPFTLSAKDTEYFILSGDLRNPFVSLVQTPDFAELDRE